MIARLVLFGATGDLTGRYLLPALAALHSAGKLPKGFRLVGAARTQLDDEAFRRHAAQELEQHAREVPQADREALVTALSYRPVDVGNAESVGKVMAEGDGPVAVYLALPPGMLVTTVMALGEVGLPGGSRMVLEKPFGEDLESAVMLNALLARVAGAEGERAVFRVDHALGLTTVQNLVAVRLANRVVEPVWNSTHIERVEILWEETLALEGRAAYYDTAGALKDVVQNHLLQVLCLLAMEPPLSFEEQDLRDRKVEVLRSVFPLTPEDIARTRRARYTAGKVAGRQIPSYTDEEVVDPGRCTETFAEVGLELDSWRWAGTRFVLRAGKALGKRRKEVVVHFRPVPKAPFGDAKDCEPNRLRIGLDGPWDLKLDLTGSAAGSPPRLAPLALQANLPAPDLPAYSRVLMDVLQGDSRLSIRADEAEESWRVLTPVIDAWAEGKVPIEEYPAGSDGPPPTDPRRSETLPRARR
ncbi:MAG TPA: glucose-6-phosphate dehydrogenase [Ktedonobacterales bacterium]